ncbi:MAG: bacteriocin [Flavobacteriaceae bacterium]|nr:bacteriocin [Flavobacteriaceae bacterium]
MNEKILTLNNNELKSINGGSFAWDAGWFIGNSIHFNNPAGIMDALTDYWLHYNT